MSTILPSVSSTKSGVLSTGTQTVAGDKSFTGNVTFSGTVAGVTATANNVEINYVAFPSSIGTGGGQWTKTGTTGAGTNSPTTTSTAGDLPLGGVISTAIQMVTGSSNGAEASHYTSCTFTTSASGSAKMKVEFHMRPGTNFASNEWTVSVYQGSTRQTLSTDSSGVTYLPNATGKFTTTFDAVASTTYTLRFARVSGTTAATLNVANVIVGTGIQPQGAVVGPGISYTPSFEGFGTVSASSFKQFRRGSRLYIEGNFTIGTPDANQALFSLPTGLSALVGTSPSGNRVIGQWTNNDTGATDPKAGPLLISNTGTNARFGYLSEAGAQNALIDRAGTFFSMTSGQIISVYCEVEIAEWAGSGTVNLAQNDVEYAYNTSGITGANASDTTSFGYGPVGATVGSINSTTSNATTNFDVQFQTPFQDGDVAQVELFTGNGWVPAESAAPYIQLGNSYYGISWDRLSNNRKVGVYFGNKGYRPGNATYAGDGLAWSSISTYKWRVRKSSAGAAVGFGIVVPGTSSGLVSASGLPGNTTGAAIASGYVGQTITSTVTGVSFTSSAVAKTATSIPLTAGIWMVKGAMSISRGSASYASSTNVDLVMSLVTTADSLTGGAETVNQFNANGSAVTTFSRQLITGTSFFRCDGTTIFREDGTALATGTTLRINGYPGTYTVANPSMDATITAVRIA